MPQLLHGLSKSMNTRDECRSQGAIVCSKRSEPRRRGFPIRSLAPIITATPALLSASKQAVGALIESVSQNRWPAPAFAFFGELPSTDTLLRSLRDESRMVAWPEWVDPTPHSERLWVSHLQGKATWKDLLQDGVAKILLGRGRSSADVLASLIRCGAFEAAIEAGHFPGFGGTDTQPLLDEARDLSTHKAEIENRLDAIDRRMRALPGIALPASNRQSIESEVYEALGEVVRRQLAAAGRSWNVSKQSWWGLSRSGMLLTPNGAAAFRSSPTGLLEAVLWSTNKFPWMTRNG